jgi:plastocyanin
MSKTKSNLWGVVMLILAVSTTSQTVKAGQSWQVKVGAESRDMGRQAMAFLPTEVWIYAGDSITWTSGTHESHTVTFLKPLPGSPPRPSNAQGCGAPVVPPAANPPTLSGSAYDGTGTACVHSGSFADGATYTVTFPNPGNFKLVCLIHRDMTGVIHVLDLLANLPHDQWFYNDEAADQARDLVSDDDRRRGEDERAEHSRHFSGNKVTTTGELVATGGGKQYLAIMRFLPETIRVHVGETVEWTNFDPAEPHTVTFGTEPAVPTTLVGLNTPSSDSDGARHGTLPNATPDHLSLNSGFIAAALQDQTAQTALGVTRVRVTFTQAGTYNYICALHDELGMKGRVVVVH